MADGKERRLDIGTKVTYAILIFTITFVLGIFGNAIWSVAWGADKKCNDACSEISSIKRFIESQITINAQLTELLNRQDNRIRDIEKAR
jgi:hypothetical protein